MPDSSLYRRIISPSLAGIKNMNSTYDGLQEGAIPVRNRAAGL